LLPRPLWQSVVSRLEQAGAPWELHHDVASLSLVSALCGPVGPEAVADGLARIDCPVAPELLRASPF
jgi:hypothetical protein